MAIMKRAMFRAMTNRWWYPFLYILFNCRNIQALTKEKKKKETYLKNSKNKLLLFKNRHTYETLPFFWSDSSKYDVQSANIRRSPECPKPASTLHCIPLGRLIGHGLVAPSQHRSQRSPLKTWWRGRVSTHNFSNFVIVIVSDVCSVTHL